jgi:hypothetical protein
MTDVNTDRANLAAYEAEVNAAPAKPNGDHPADYRRNVDMTRHTEEEVHGGRTQFSQETKTDDKSSGDFDNRVVQLVNGQIKAREARENSRANHRNVNRELMLIMTILIGFVLVFLTSHAILPKAFTPYSFVITVMMDLVLTTYALIKRY